MKEFIYWLHQLLMLSSAEWCAQTRVTGQWGEASGVIANEVIGVCVCVCVMLT
jgi:hypothetical protein